MKKSVLFIFVLFLLAWTACSVCAVNDNFGFPDNVDVEQLIEYIETQSLSNGLIKFDNLGFDIPNSCEFALKQLCEDNIPMLFDRDNLLVTKGVKGNIKSLKFDCDDEYKTKRQQCEATATELLEGIKGNDNLDDVTKALLLHDRIAEICAYGKIDNNLKDSFEICGPLIYNTSYCTGYSKAYMYLLRQVGIECRLIRSKEMNHTWVAVTINGKEYNVDLAFDERTPDVTGRVHHDLFLISADKLKEGQHGKYTDWDTSANDKKYDADSWFWKNSISMTREVGGKLYYIDYRKGKEALYRVEIKGTGSYNAVKIKQFPDRWSMGNKYIMNYNYYCLSSDGTNIYYSTPVYIYKYTPKSGEIIEFWSPFNEATYGYNDTIVGFRYSDGKFVCSIFAYDTKFNGNTDKEFQVTKDLKDIKPTENGNVEDDKTPGTTDPDGTTGNNNNGNNNNQTPSGNNNNQTPSGNNNKPNQSTNSFVDVKKSHWAADAITFVVQKGYMKGMGEGIFDPSGNIKREQFVIILANLSGTNTDIYKNTKTAFTDVKTGAWYSGAVAWAVKQGYVNGMSDTLFGTGQDITRGQLAKLLYVYAEKQGMDVKGRADISGFADAGLVNHKNNSWMKAPIQWAVSEGIISGMEINGKLSVNPNGTATRAQTAIMLQNFLNS